MTDRELADHVRGRLNLAVNLACQSEQERRSGHWAAAEQYQQQWEHVMAEVKRLLPQVRKSRVSLFEKEKIQPLRSHQKAR